MTVAALAPRYLKTVLRSGYSPERSSASARLKRVELCLEQDQALQLMALLARRLLGVAEQALAAVEVVEEAVASVCL